MGDTPSYIKSLLMPSAKPAQGRKVWSIDLQRVWIPFLLSTNVMGDTAIPADALGAPLRLAYDKDGMVKFSTSGRPVIKVVKSVAEVITLVRENFTANLLSYANGVATNREADYTALVKRAMTEAEPIQAHDKAELEKAVTLQVQQAVREAEAKAKAEANAEAVAKAEAVKGQAPAGTNQQGKREAVTV